MLYIKLAHPNLQVVPLFLNKKEQPFYIGLLFFVYQLNTTDKNPILSVLTFAILLQKFTRNYGFFASTSFINSLWNTSAISKPSKIPKIVSQIRRIIAPCNP